MAIRKKPSVEIWNLDELVKFKFRKKIAGALLRALVLHMNTSSICRVVVGIATTPLQTSREHIGDAESSKN